VVVIYTFFENWEIEKQEGRLHTHPLDCLRNREADPLRINRECPKKLSFLLILQHLFFPLAQSHRGSFPYRILTSARNRQNRPQKMRYPSLGGSGHDLPLSKKRKGRRHDRRHPTRKKNRKAGQSGQVWKAAQRKPISRGDITCLSSM
jgi:hypothetical protein